MTHSEFFNKYNIRLSSEQEKCVLKTNGRVLCTAVPGSGKTTMLITKTGYLIKCLGISPDEVLLLTFSVSATKDMKNRYISLFGDEAIPSIQTIHSFCLSVCEKYFEARRLPKKRILSDSTEQKKIIADICKKQKLNAVGMATVEQLLSELTQKRNGIKPKYSVKTGYNVDELYQSYTEYKEQNGLIDFDDQLEICYRVLTEESDIADYFLNKYRYICVDEAQDTSILQQRIIDLMQKAHGNLFMVGDEDQSIYGFRAAYPEAFSEFDGEILMLTENFRSTKRIIELSDSFISQNKSRIQKTMQTKASGKKTDCELIRLKTYMEQYDYILSEAKKEKGSVAILYRNTESALPLYDIFEKNKIDFSSRGKESVFFRSNTINKLLCGLRFSMEQKNPELFLRLYKYLNPGISENIVSECYFDGSKNVFDVLYKNYTEKGLSTENIECLASVMNKIAGSKTNRAIKELLKHMRLGMIDILRINVLFSLANKHPDKTDFLERIKLLSESVINDTEPNNSKIYFSTMHSSKGREFDRVIIIDAFLGVTPTSLPQKAASPYEAASMEEERRLFYVACTRARKKLDFIVYPRDCIGNKLCFYFVNSFMGK